METLPNSKLRLIQVVNVRWVNATAWYALFLSRLLQEAGHEVLVLGLEGTDSFKLAQTWGLRVKALPLNSASPLAQISLYRSLAEILREFRPHLVNCHRGESFFLWGLLRQKARRDFRNAGGAGGTGGNGDAGSTGDTGSRAAASLPPFALVRTRGDRRPIRNNMVNRLLYARWSDALIATNSEIARSMQDQAGAAPAKIHTILGGVDEKLFYPDAAAGQSVRQACGFGERDFVVGLLGRLDEVKGHALLIRALGLCRAANPTAFNLKFLCIGADSQLNAADIAALLEASGLDRKSTLVTGKVDKVHAYLNALDLGVLASTGSEAIARAALEIMACGRPLLSSDVGVMPDLLPPDLLLPAGDAPALAAALRRYSSDPAALAELGRVCSQRVAGLFSGDFLRQSLAVYESCITP